MNDLRLKESLEIIKGFWDHKKGYQPWKPAGLCPEVRLFKNTFNPSATHVQMYKILKGEQSWEHSNYYVVEPVYRHPDVGAVGDKSHLSLFHMLGVVQLIPADLPDEAFVYRRREFIGDVVEFLDMLGLDPQGLVATYFRGGSLLGLELPRDEGLKDLLTERGFLNGNILGMGGTFAFLYMPEKEIDLAGWRSDLYLKCSDNSLLEIATLDFSEHLSHKGLSGLKKNEKFKLLGFYAGVERLVSTQVHGDIWKVKDLNELVERLHVLLKTRHRYSNGPYFAQIIDRDVKVFIDRLRAIFHIGAAGQLPDNSDRGQILKRLIQDVNRFCHSYLGEVDHELASEVLCQISVMDSLSPSLIANTLATLKSGDNREQRLRRELAGKRAS